ncbi:MAG: hypothetical protein AAGG68_19235, partial [Bacteroidota bacterium]
FLSAADIEASQINIKDKNSNKKYILLVQHDKMSEIARLFLGTNVAAEAKEDQKGQMVLQDIRWAA